MSAEYDEHIILIFEGRPQQYFITKYFSSKSETKTNIKAWSIEIAYVSLYNTNVQNSYQNISSCVETHWMEAISPQEEKSFRCHAKSVIIWMFTILNALFYLSFHVVGTFTESNMGVLSQASSYWKVISLQEAEQHKVDEPSHGCKLAAHILKLPKCRAVVCGCPLQPVTHQLHP